MRVEYLYKEGGLYDTTFVHTVMLNSKERRFLTGQKAQGNRVSFEVEPNIPYLLLSVSASSNTNAMLFTITYMSFNEDGSNKFKNTVIYLVPNMVTFAVLFAKNKVVMEFFRSGAENGFSQPTGKEKLNAKDIDTLIELAKKLDGRFIVVDEPNDEEQEEGNIDMLSKN